MASKFPDIRDNSYSGKAISIVIEKKQILGPDLATQLGISIYEMSSAVRKAVTLGYIKKERTVANGLSNVNLYSMGPALTPALVAAAQAAADPAQEAVPEKPQERPLEIVPPRTAPKFRPLRLARIGPATYRPGSWDFKSIPSAHATSKKEPECV
ncbi:hypothetical protein EDC30_102235 [Paucimonas lemoignei]|uniref:Uncharacterized protein n=1 Tax=Paucimonas lemoignei TaxID=29443 RepID=A0A4R3HYS0_PAULE|nr:hypothetical protein [Paucimonas lemoignei]TCS38496.1 hypothetical protein EDC30_102235 [Paucimonas lemoignei]